ncbi:MAG TPA: hypothetical protein VND80_07335, partial [Steroidobacteraceae bacterium]|nr:hypothetical protein [Steroidobacteraceae bacterium]
MSGNWSTRSEWTGCSTNYPNNGTPAGDTYSATIGASGTYTVTLTGAIALDGLTMNASGATLDLASNTLTTNVTGGVALQSGTLSNGTIQAGVGTTAVSLTGANSSGTLDAVTLNGSLDITGGNATALIASGITLNGTSGTGAGTINLGTNGSYSNSLEIAPTTTTLSNVNINIGEAGNSAYNNQIVVAYGGSGTLTLASSVNIQDTGTGAYDYIRDSSTGTLVNDGTIGVSGTRTLYIQPTTFTNGSTGTLTANAGTTLSVQPTTFTNDSGGKVTGLDGSTVNLQGAITNAGTIDIGTATSTAATTKLQLGTANTSSASSATAWSNTGTVNVENASLYLGGSFTAADVGTVNYLGTNALYLNGYLDNSGSTSINPLNLASGALAGLVMAGGTIHGGVIVGSAGNLFTGANSYGTLDGVTLNGSLDITGGNRATIANGITLNGTGGTGAGTINLGTDGTNSNNLYIAPTTTTLGNVNINIGKAGSSGYANYLYVGYGGAGTLTLASTVNIQDTGTGGYDYITDSSPGTLVNDGTIGVSGTRTLYINPTTFTNGATGTLTANAGATLLIDPTTFTNLAGGTLTGGTYQANGNGTVIIYGVPVVTLAANVTLNGAGSTLESYNTSNGRYTTLDSSLTTIGPSGTLAVLGNRNYTTANAITNQGTLQLGGGTFDAASLANGGTLTGFGTVTPAIANTGSVVANGGTLTATAGIQGATGTATSNAGATLALGATSSAGTLVNNGSLVLGTNNVTVSSDYQNAGFGTGNSFNNHANVTGTGEILAAGNAALSVTGTGGTVFTGSGDSLGLAVNVHVGPSGAGTANFNIGNTGSTGPVLRGAVLTSAGVTASAPGFGPIALGGSVGDSVTISQASAGALAGQSFRVVSNFDNVAPVIVTVSGAAYNLASGSTADVVLGAQRVGGTGTGALVVSNTAPSGTYTEVLNATTGATTGAVNAASGSISGGLGAGGVAGGSSNGTAMTVGLDTT